MRDDVREFADALGLSRFHLIGHSMGATTSILFAEQWPTRVDHLVLEDTSPPSGREQIPAPSPEPPEPVSFDWAVLAPIIHQLNNPDPAWWADLGNISAPTLVIGGGHGSFIDQTELSDMVSRIPKARLVTIEAGHQVHSTKPDEFASAVQAFLIDRYPLEQRTAPFASVRDCHQRMRGYRTSPSDTITFMIRVGSIVLRVTDLRRQTEFWAAALDYVPREDDSDDFVLLRPRGGVGPNLSLDMHPSDAPLPPRIHLDLYAEDQASEVERLVALGASEVHWDKRPTDADYVILADPEGNRFCVIDASE